MNSRPKHTVRRWVLTALAAIAIPLSSLTFAQSAVAIGDVCDLCSINFDPTACDASGFAPYDSTVTDRYGTPLGGTVAPVPAAPAPAPAPAAPAPVAPAAPVTAPPATKTGTGKQAAAPAPAPAAPAAPAVAETSAAVGVPASPAAPTVSAEGASLLIAWAAPADGGSPITGYRVALNGGAGVDVASAESSYTFEKLTAGEYSATVVATNAAGESAASPASAVIEVADGPTAKTVANTEAVAAEEGAPSTVLSGALILVALLAVGGIVLLANYIRTSGGIAAARERFSRPRRTSTD